MVDKFEVGKWYKLKDGVEWPYGGTEKLAAWKDGKSRKCIECDPEERWVIFDGIDDGKWWYNFNHFIEVPFQDCAESTQTATAGTPWRGVIYSSDGAMYVAAATNRWMTAYESIKYVPSILDSTKIIMPKLGYAHQSRKSMRRSIIDRSKDIKY